jgi:hypothetical protein
MFIFQFLGILWLILLTQPLSDIDIGYSHFIERLTQITKNITSKLLKQEVID